VTADDVVTELKLLAFANIMDFMRIGENGDPYIDMSAMTRAQATALAEFTVDDYMEGRGEDAREVKRIRIKMHDKLRPLVELGKHLGMFQPCRPPRRRTGTARAPARLEAIASFASLSPPRTGSRRR
jgi:phage terminase small subunit